ncbi:MAG: hypothetical protein IT515_08895, partial [Burkholderiales bacterium]|nr:hypothetical protein [Burkholderiales bacterium]
MTPEVSEELGRRLNHKRIGRLIREHELCSRKRLPFRMVTTDSRHDHPIAPNVLERDFAVSAPSSLLKFVVISWNSSRRKWSKDRRQEQRGADDAWCRRDSGQHVQLSDAER